MGLSLELGLSLWGAILSTLLAIATLASALRARPIVKVAAKLSEKEASDNPTFVSVEKPVGPYGDIRSVEIFVEFLVRNAGEKDIWLNGIFVETDLHVNIVRPTGLPQVLLARTSLEIEVQKELFDSIDLTTGARKPAAVVSTGVIDSLGKRYPIPGSDLACLLKACLDAPTTMSLFKRKDGRGGPVMAYQVVHDGKLIRKPRNSKS